MNSGVEARPCKKLQFIFGRFVDHDIKITFLGRSSMPRCLSCKKERIAEEMRHEPGNIVVSHVLRTGWICRTCYQVNHSLIRVRFNSSFVMRTEGYIFEIDCFDGFMYFMRKLTIGCSTRSVGLPVLEQTEMKVGLRLQYVSSN